jgi:hypothetical protein
MSQLHVRALAPSEQQIAHVARKLRNAVYAQRALIVVMLVFGVPLLALGPAAFASLMFVMGGGGWTFWYRIGWVTILPLLFWLETRSHGHWGEEALVEYNPDNPIEVIGGYQGGQLIFITILSLLGPGLVLGAWRRIRGQWRHRKTSVHRCAEAAAQLLRADGGVDIFTLQKQGESFEDVLSVVEYLVHYDWAGAGKDGTRVWVLTDAKRVLED